MKKQKCSKIFELLAEGKKQRACFYLEQILMEKCFGFLISISPGLDKEQRMELFNEALLKFCEEIESGKFVYKTEAGCISYFMTKCQHQVWAFYRDENRRRRLFQNIDDLMQRCDQEELALIVQEELENFYLDYYEQFGIEIDFDEEISQISKILECIWEKIKKLTPLCQDLIHLKFFEKLTWEDIAKIMDDNFEMEGKILKDRANVYKTTFNRCMNRLRILAKDCYVIILMFLTILNFIDKAK